MTLTIVIVLSALVLWTMLPTPGDRTTAAKDRSRDDTPR